MQSCFWNRIRYINPEILACGGSVQLGLTGATTEKLQISGLYMRQSKAIFTIVSSVGLLTLLTGCSSVMCGSRQAVSINSRPAGAEVLVYNSDCQVVCRDTTPCVATLRRSSPDGEAGSYTLVIQKKGFAPAQVPLTGKVNDAYYANIIFGGVGLLVDSATGAKWTLTPEVDADLDGSDTRVFKHDDVLVSLKPSTSETTRKLAEYKPGQQ